MQSNIWLFLIIGGKWALTFENAVKSPHVSKSPQKQIKPVVAEPQGDSQEQASEDTHLSPNNEYYKLMFNLYLMTYYQATNIAEAYMT